MAVLRDVVVLVEPGSRSCREPSWASPARTCGLLCFLGNPVLRWQQGQLHEHATHTWKGPGTGFMPCRLGVLLLNRSPHFHFVVGPKLWCWVAGLAWPRGSPSLLRPRNGLGLSPCCFSSAFRGLLIVPVSSAHCLLGSLESIRAQCGEDGDPKARGWGPHGGRTETPRGTTEIPRGKGGDPTGEDGDSKGKTGTLHGEDGHPRGEDEDPKGEGQRPYVGRAGTPCGEGGDPTGDDGESKGEDGDPTGEDEVPTGEDGDPTWGGQGPHVGRSETLRGRQGPCMGRTVTPGGRTRNPRGRTEIPRGEDGDPTGGGWGHQVWRMETHMGRMGPHMGKKNPLWSRSSMAWLWVSSCLSPLVSDTQFFYSMASQGSVQGPSLSSGHSSLTAPQPSESPRLPSTLLKSPLLRCNLHTVKLTLSDAQFNEF